MPLLRPLLLLPTNINNAAPEALVKAIISYWVQPKTQTDICVPINSFFLLTEVIVSKMFCKIKCLTTACNVLFKCEIQFITETDIYIMILIDPLRKIMPPYRILATNKPLEHLRLSYCLLLLLLQEKTYNGQSSVPFCPTE